MNKEPNYPPLMGTQSRVEAAEGEHGGRPFGMDGYVRLHRTLPDWEWYHDDACLRLLIHLLMRVNWKPGRWKGMDVHPGSTVTSMERMAEALGWSRSKLRHTLDKLKSSGDVAITTTNHWTAVTLVNWAKYQKDDQPSSQPNDQPTANRWPAEQPTNSQPMAIIEEGKKERKKEVAGKPPKRDADWFKEECKKVVDELPDVLAKSERAAFFDYWTEPSASGNLRFAAQKFFDFKRRMQNWQRRANEKQTFASKAKGPMTKADAEAWIEKYKERLGIKPGEPIPTAEIPNDIYHAWRGYAKS